MPTRIKIFFDGGWRPARGMETAVVVRGQVYVRQDLGAGSSMEAEWLALIDAVRVAQRFGMADVVLLGDAVAVIAQATGTVKCRGACVQYLGAFQTLVTGAPPRIRHIGRHQNLAGIALGRLHAG